MVHYTGGENDYKQYVYDNVMDARYSMKNDHQTFLKASERGKKCTGMKNSTSKYIPRLQCQNDCFIPIYPLKYENGSFSPLHHQLCDTYYQSYESCQEGFMVWLGIYLKWSCTFSKDVCASVSMNVEVSELFVSVGVRCGGVDVTMAVQYMFPCMAE